MKKNCITYILFAVLGFCFNGCLFNASLLFQDDHGYGYLNRVVNNSNFDATLSFNKASFGPFSIPSGSSFGDELRADTEIISDIIAPVSAITKTRIFHNGLDQTKGTDSRIDKQPVVQGAAIKEINAFDANQMLMLQPMYGKAVAWFSQQDLTNPLAPTLNMTISFLAYVRDSGQVQILLSDSEEASAHWRWKIVLDSAQSGQAQIYLRKANEELLVATTNNADTHFARLEPGKMNRFWISLKNNQIIVGKSQNGQNSFLIWTETGQPQRIKRLGFSCDKEPVTIARITAMSAVHPKVTVAPLASLAVANLPQTAIALREPGAGAMQWSGDQNFAFRLQQNQNDQEVLECSLKERVLEMHYRVAGQVVKSQKFEVDQDSRFWVVLDQKTFVLGQGELNKTGIIAGLFVHEALQRFNTIVWQDGPPEQATLFSAANLATTTWNGSKDNKSLFSGTVKIYQPYKYSFDQEGPSIVGKDELYNKTYILGKAPQQGAFYPFELTIDYDGTPVLKWYNKPINIGAFFLNITAMALRITEAITYMAINELTNTKAPTVREDLIVTASTIGLAGAGAAQGSIAALLEAEADVGLRSSNAYGYTETVEQKIGIKANEKMTKEYSDQVGLLLRRSATLNINKPKDFNYALQLYADAIGYVLDFLVLTESQRGQIVSGVMAIAELALQAYKNESLMLTKVVNLILSILNHQYFFNLNNLAHQQQAIKLNQVLQQVNVRRFFKYGRSKIPLPKGETKFLWTGKKIDQKGSVFFSVKANDGVTVQLLPVNDATAAMLFEKTFQDGQLLFSNKVYSWGQFAQQSWLEKGSNVYQIMLGAEKNQLTCIKVSEQGNKVAEILAKQLPEAALSPFKFKQYWIGFEAGRLIVGQGPWGQKKFLEWQDPYPHQGLFLVSISGFDGTAELQDFRVGPSLERLTPALIGGMTPDELENQKQLQEEQQNLSSADLAQNPEQDLMSAQSIFDNDVLTKQDPLKDDLMYYQQVELEYSPLLIGDLNYDAWDRDDVESKIYQQFYAEKAAQKPDVDEDAEKEAARRQMSKEAAQDRQARGQTQKAQLQGFAGIAQEATQFKNFIVGDLGNVGKALGRKLSSGVASGATKKKKSIDRNLLASAEGASEKDDTIKDRNAKLSKPPKRVRSKLTKTTEVSGAKKGKDEVEANKDKSKDKIDWSSGAIGQEIKQFAGLPSIFKSMPDLKSKLIYEFTGKRTGKLAEASAQAGGKGKKDKGDQEGSGESAAAIRGDRNLDLLQGQVRQAELEAAREAADAAAEVSAATRAQGENELSRPESQPSADLAGGASRDGSGVVFEGTRLDAAGTRPSEAARVLHRAQSSSSGPTRTAEASLARQASLESAGQARPPEEAQASGLVDREGVAGSAGDSSAGRNDLAMAEKEHLRLNNEFTAERLAQQDSFSNRRSFQATLAIVEAGKAAQDRFAVHQAAVRSYNELKQKLNEDLANVRALTGDPLLPLSSHKQKELEAAEQAVKDAAQEFRQAQAEAAKLFFSPDAEKWVRLRQELLEKEEEREKLLVDISKKPDDQALLTKLDSLEDEILKKQQEFGFKDRPEDAEDVNEYIAMRRRQAFMSDDPAEKDTIDKELVELAKYSDDDRARVFEVEVKYGVLGKGGVLQEGQMSRYDELVARKKLLPEQKKELEELTKDAVNIDAELEKVRGKHGIGDEVGLDAMASDARLSAEEKAVVARRQAYEALKNPLSDEDQAELGGLEAKRKEYSALLQDYLVAKANVTTNLPEMLKTRLRRFFSIDNRVQGSATNETSGLQGFKDVLTKLGLIAMPVALGAAKSYGEQPTVEETNLTTLSTAEADAREDLVANQISVDKN